jgi:signal transduction histidine kinase
MTLTTSRLTFVPQEHRPRRISRSASQTVFLGLTVRLRLEHTVGRATSLDYDRMATPSRRSLEGTRAKRRIGDRVVSLRLSLALIIAVLALVPPVVLVAFLLSPVVGTPYALEPGAFSRLIGWLILVVCVSLGVGYLISRILLEPLTRLRDEVSNLARSGRRLSEMTLADAGSLPIEVETVREAFSSVLDALRTEQMKRGAFMATLVHDLKTPVIAGNHVLDAIRDEGMSKEQRLELINSLRRENDALLELVQKMVDAHRFERGEVALDLEATDLEPLVRGIAARLEGIARVRGLRLTVTGRGRAMVARRELERALLNLIENALRYARSNVTVTIDGPSVTVTDDGPGLSAPLEMLAKPFHSETLEFAGQEFTSGTGGLGLFIAWQIVLSHRGTLEHLNWLNGTVLRVGLKSP